MVWSSTNGPNVDLPLWQNRLSRCWGALLSVVEHVPWVERCPNGVSQYYVPLHLAQKMCIHGLIQYKWPECWLAFMAKPTFQLLRSLVVCGRACFMGWKVSQWSQSLLCTTAVGSESMYSWCDPVKRLEYWLAFMGEMFFQVSKNIVVRGRVSSTDGKVIR